MSSANDQKQQDSNKSQGNNIFEGFSFVQVLASGLAAGTSFALSAQIGVAGSLIGAVLGAFASTAALQVYKNILNKSAEKLHELGPNGDADNGRDQGEKTAATQSATFAQETTVLDADATVLMGTDETVAHSGATVEQNWEPTSLSGRTVVSEVAKSGTPVAPEEIRKEARAREQKVLRRRAAIICTIAAIGVVLVFALVVSVATQGSGIQAVSVDEAEKEVVVEDDETEDTESESSSSGFMTFIQRDNSSSSSSNDSSSEDSSTNGTSTDTNSTTTNSNGNSSTTDSSSDSSSTTDSTDSGSTSSDSSDDSVDAESSSTDAATE